MRGGGRALGRALLAFALFLCGPQRGVWGVSSDDPFAQWLNGAKGFERALEKRQGTSDAMLLYFYTEWCPHCKEFNTTVAASRQMQEYVRHVIAVRVNPEAGPKEKSLAEQFAVTGYPTLFVISPETNQPQDVSAARGSPEMFVAACEEAGRKPSVKKRSVAQAPTARASGASAAVRKIRTADQQTPGAAKNVLHLKNGNIVEGTVERLTAQDVVLDVDGVGSLVFSREEIDRIDGELPAQVSR